jgi:signal transduction histidine kinase
MQPLDETLLELQRFMHKEMEFHHIVFANTFCPGTPNLCFDRERLKEAIMNLYKNSADAMPEGGEISTVTRVMGGWAEILISDTGPGISDTEAESLFRPFSTTKKGGTGLGLTIVEEILGEHGGGIEVRREPDEGMLLALRLPLQS